MEKSNTNKSNLSSKHQRKAKRIFSHLLENRHISHRTIKNYDESLSNLEPLSISDDLTTTRLRNRESQNIISETQKM